MDPVHTATGMMLSYKYRAYPSDSQIGEIHDHFDIHATIYNKTLDTLDSGDNISRYDMQTRLTQWKKGEPVTSIVWNAKAAQQTVGRVYKAISGLSELKDRGHSVGKLRHQHSFNSIEYNQSGFDVNEETIRIHPFGEIPVNKHRPVTGDIKGLTIKEQDSGKWHISVHTEVETAETIPLQDIESPDVVGIDFNISNLFTDSDERMFQSMWEYLEPKMERVNREQQKLSRKEQGSNNWEKQRVRVAKAREKLANTRNDILHKLSRWYVDTFDAIALEDINSADISRSPVKYVGRQAWSKFKEYVQYKASHAGVHVFEVSPEYTSQDCSNTNCNNRVEKELSERTHECGECGLTIDRDLNAARNILARAISQTVGQGLSESTPWETGSAGEITNISLRTVVERGSPNLSE